MASDRTAEQVLIADLLRYAEAAVITSQHAALHREAARSLAELMELLDESQTGWKRELKENARLTAERDQARPDREAAKARLHPVLHELDVRITDLPGDCHCNLVAEVILDALYGREGQTEEGADRDE